MMLRMVVRSVLGSAVFGLFLFLAAGTVAWPQGWIFLALFIGCGVAIGVWLGIVDPALLAERMKSPLSRDQNPADRMVMGAIMATFWGWFVFAAIDAKRFEWSHVPVWLQVAGVILILVAFYGWVAVLRVNTFASVNIRVQAERKQTVISTGPYAIVRHPMYSYALLFMLGSALLLGSLWSLLGVVLLVFLLAARIRGEEKMLFEGLEGYRDYAAKVRFRLVPGIW